MEDFMNRDCIIISAILALFSVRAVAQQSAPPTTNQNPSAITVRGCVRSERGNYILIEDRTGAIYALQGVGAKLQGFLRKEVEVTGEIKTGSIKTGIRPEKAGSNPADTVHGMDGVPLQVRDIRKNIRVVAKHCTAADHQ
jgi:hypothetical protein